MRALSYLLTTAALLIAVRADGPLACGYASNGQTVDLSPLIVSSGTDYNSQPDAGGYSYELNVCAASTTTVANCQAAQAAVCQTKGGNFVATVAKWPASGTPSGFTLINNDITQGVELSFANGDSCFPTSQPRTARIQFVCGTTTVGQISTVSGGTSGCDYTITFPTSYACVGGSNPGGNGGGKGKLSGGWVFVIILLVTTFVYFVAGWGWNHYKHREEGWGFVQKCPNIEFWKKIPGLVKDGAKFTWAGIGSCIGRCTGRTSTASEGEGSYENVK